LKEIDDPNERAQILTDYNNKLEQQIQPGDLVTKVIEMTKRRQPPNKEGSTFTSLFKAQLDELSKGRKKLFEEMEQKGSDKK
ncbi:MAG: flagellar biosynthesis protein FliZ, partial [Bacillota bacterium]|nr:flagellar biosynthesis protein FliZ [Bacillota bacterium]